MDQMLKKPEVAKYLQESIITQRNGRYVLPLKAEARTNVPGIVHDQSTSGATIYVEPQAMVEANNKFRKLELDERDEIQRILAELTAKVAEHGPVLLEMVESLIRLDLAFARGRYALVLNALASNTASFSEETGKRPSRCCIAAYLVPAIHFWILEQVVAIDVALDKETYALIITGPNTGGKTVTLKTVGLLVLMAQSGLHIPAIRFVGDQSFFQYLC